MMAGMKGPASSPRLEEGVEEEDAIWNDGRDVEQHGHRWAIQRVRSGHDRESIGVICGREGQRARRAYSRVGCIMMRELVQDSRVSMSRL